MSKSSNVMGENTFWDIYSLLDELCANPSECAPGTIEHDDGTKTMGMLVCTGTLYAVLNGYGREQGFIEPLKEQS